VLIGGKGSGKGTFGNALCKIFGQHALHAYSSELLVGRFNAHLRDLCFLFADEAYWPGDKSAEGVLKGLITEPDLAIEAKGIDTVTSPNRLHILMASNEEWVVPATMDERRFAVFALSNHRVGDDEYFGNLHAQLYEQGGLAAMLHDLLQLDLRGWHPRRHIPQTDALARQKSETLSPIERFWFECLVTGELPSFAEPYARGGVFLATSDVAEFLSRRQTRPVSAVKVAEFLGLGRVASPGMGFQKDDVRRPRGFHVPTLSEAREVWDRTRFAYDWPQVGGWSVLGQRESERWSPF
jgi:hypothetical protein